MNEGFRRADLPPMRSPGMTAHLSPKSDRLIVQNAAFTVENRLKREGITATVCGVPAYQAYGALTLGLSEIEHMCMASFDGDGRLIDSVRLTSGSVFEASLHNREVIREALAVGARGVVLYHCHPSGDPTPGGADIMRTYEARDALAAVGVGLHDHVVVGGGETRSILRDGRDLPLIGLRKGPATVQRALDAIQAQTQSPFPHHETATSTGHQALMVAKELSKQCPPEGGDFWVYMDSQCHVLATVPAESGTYGKRRRQTLTEAVKHNAVKSVLLRALPNSYDAEELAQPDCWWFSLTAKDAIHSAAQAAYTRKLIDLDLCDVMVGVAQSDVVLSTGAHLQPSGKPLFHETMETDSCQVPAPDGALEGPQDTCPEDRLNEGMAL